MIKLKTVRSCWADGFASARFDTCFEDEDDVTREEYNSFAFKILSVEGSVPVEISDDNLCVINYINSPQNIMLGQKDILRL